MLNSFAGDVAGDRNIFGLAADFVDFVNIDDAALGSLDIEVGRLEETKNDVLDIFTDIAGFSQSGGIDDAEGNVQKTGKSLGKKSFSGSGWSQKEDIGFFDLNIGIFVIGILMLAQALVVIVNSDGEDFFRVLLSDDEVVEVLEKFRWCWNSVFEQAGEILGWLRLPGEFFAEDGRTDVDALITDVDAGTGDELFDLRVTFATEGTHGEIICAGHGGILLR